MAGSWTRCRLLAANSSRPLASQRRAFGRAATVAARGPSTCIVAPALGSERGSLPSRRRFATDATTEAEDPYEWITTPSGLQYCDVVVGDGAMPSKGWTVKVDYIGVLADGKEFDHGHELEFPVGNGLVIAGWDEALLTMRVGGKRCLRIPPELGYGDRESGKIPPNSTLFFECTLLDAVEPEPEPDWITSPSGLQYVDVAVGDGEMPSRGQIVKVHYTGKLTSGREFDSSIPRGEPLEFAVGTGLVIAGWDEGILSMRVGSKRRLKIPPELGYGPEGHGPIPADATLLFDCELVGLGEKPPSLWNRIFGR
eukprot:TRINITY_DN18630_c0_g1_i4.p1 TRINITY_DN18630_c0_g1~~TRINITY_DN18630_c0_g1_i4.p1  ORF type:complete len:311 (-),score=32.57 TRINITY_DN18630_c0_g1_i4:101-1033(-)